VVSHQRARELVDAAVSCDLETWAKIIKLTPSDTRFAQFREDVTQALRACVEVHIAEQVTSFKKFTRIADMRKHLEKEAREARTLAKRLKDFTSKYVVGHPTLVLRPGRVFDPGALAQDFDLLAVLRESQAKACKDTGGSTPKMLAFEALAEGLTRAYSRATGRKGTGGNVREGRSRLRQLVEAVLPAACKLAIAATGKPLKTPTTWGLGDRLDEIAERLQKRGGATS
jgi:hypothetical protein